ncbi:Endogenous retrovirus group 3 member 1 Env polyprotein [Plecturocebus cupreus]
MPLSLLKYMGCCTKRRTVKFWRERTFSKQKMEQINSLGKMCQETELKWVQALPLVLFNIIPPMKSYIIGPLPYCRHSWELLGSDHVWIKDWSAAPLKPRWKGPQTVILIIPTAVKVEGIPAWIHHSRAKPAAAETWEATPNPDNDCKITLKRTTSPAPATSRKLAGPLGTLTNFEECSQCVHQVTKAGCKVTTVLLFYSYYECTGTQKGTSLYNGTQYKVCNPGDGQPDVCYDPSEPPTHTTFEIRLLTGQWNSPTKLIARAEEKGSPKQVTLRFDACAAINAYVSSRGWGCGSLGWEQSPAKERKYICQKTYWCSKCIFWSCVLWATWKNNTHNPIRLIKGRDNIPGSNVPCISGHCNPVELIITNPQDPKLEKGENVMLGIDENGLDPRVSIQIQRKIQTHSAQPAYQPFYNILNERTCSSNLLKM